MNRNILVISFLSTIGLAACGGEPGQKLDTPTSGFIRIMVDEGYQPIIESSIDVFDSIYRQAKIEAQYVPEGQAMKALLDDSMQVIIITRKLSTEENEYLTGKSGGAPPKTTAIAFDAVAFILHPENHDTVFTVQQIHDILSGKTTKWAQINPKSKLGDIRVVFDHAQSGTVRYAKDSILNGQPIFAGASALQTNKEVINYVSKNKSALGIIGANWVSDTDDGGVQKFLAEVQLADIASEPGAEGFGPYQAYLAQGNYPFKRTVYVINTQYRAGLGLGLASFLASDPGQRIVMKSGMLPANVPIRLIKTKPN